MIRLFVAIAIPDEAAAVLAPLAGGVPGARWSPRENLHVTLRFCGEVPEPVAEDLDAALGAIAVPPFVMALRGVGSFGDGRDLHALWAGVEAGEPLQRLRRRCESAARGAGLKPDTRAFHPHVTLAYLSGAEPARAAAWIQTHNLVRTEPFAVDRFGLYSSRMGRAGSVYSLERSYRLG